MVDVEVISLILTPFDSRYRMSLVIEKRINRDYDFAFIIKFFGVFKDVIVLKLVGKQPLCSKKKRVVT